MANISEGFGLKPENRPIGAVNLQETITAINKLAPEFMLRKHDPVLGCCMGGLLGDFLWTIHRKDAPSSQISKEIGQIRSHYRTILGDDFNLFWAGFVAEYAAASCVNTIGYPVYKPTQVEDTQKGVDFWIDLESPNDRGKQYIAVQVKTVATGCDPRGHLIYPLSHNSPLSNDLFCHWGCPHDGVRRIYESRQKLKKYVGGFDNVEGVVVILPSPGSEHGLFNEQTGSLLPVFPKIFCEELENKVIYT